MQQPGFVRVKRGLRTIPLPAALKETSPSLGGDDSRSSSTTNIPTDPYFQFQWYLLNTGQNGGKMRLDLNVQAAWDQGITGKNVTTAIMDDGEALLYALKCDILFVHGFCVSLLIPGVDYMHPDLKFNYVSGYHD